MKTLQTFGIGAIPSQSTATQTKPPQQTTILDLSNTRYARLFTLSSGFVTLTRNSVTAGVALSDLVQALVTLEPTLTWPPVITVQPVNVTVLHPNPTSFSITATAEVTITYQWQISTNGGSTWANVTDGPIGNGGNYSGSLTNTLNISNSTGLNANQFRCVATDISGFTNSNAGVLTVT